MEVWRGAELLPNVGREFGDGAIAVGRAGRPSESWMLALPFGPDQYFLSGAGGVQGFHDLNILLPALLEALPPGRHRIYHYDQTWLGAVASAFGREGFVEFVHRYSMHRRLPAPLPDQARVTLEPLGPQNQAEFLDAYASCLKECLSPMSLEDTMDPRAALRFHMLQGRSEDTRRWWLGRTEDGEVLGMVLLDRYGPTDQDWVVTFVGTTEVGRGKGYARELLLRGADSACLAGARVLHLAVCQPNLPALRLYERTGFKVSETYRVFRREVG